MSKSDFILVYILLYRSVPTMSELIENKILSEVSNFYCTEMSTHLKRKVEKEESEKDERDLVIMVRRPR